MDGVQSVLETKYGQDRQLVLHWFEALQQHGVHSLHDLGKKLSNDNEWRNIPLDLLAKALLRQSHDYLTNNTQSTEDQHLSQDDSNYSKYSQDLITLGHEVAKEKEQMLHKEVVCMFKCRFQWFAYLYYVLRNRCDANTKATRTQNNSSCYLQS